MQKNLICQNSMKFPDLLNRLWGLEYSAQFPFVVWIQFSYISSLKWKEVWTWIPSNLSLILNIFKTEFQKQKKGQEKGNYFLALSIKFLQR